MIKKENKGHKRRKKLIKRMVDLSKQKGGKKPALGKIMKEVGYSDAYAKNPYKLKGTETFQELLDIMLPKERTVEVHMELQEMASIEHYVFPKMGRGAKARDIDDATIKQIVESVKGCKLIYIKPDTYMGKIAFFQAPDGKIRKDAVEMAYKLRGVFAPEQIELTKRKYQDLSNEDLMALKKKLQDHLKKK